MAPPGLWPWAPRVLPVIGFALQAGGGLPPSGVIKHRCAGDVGALSGRHDIPPDGGKLPRSGLQNGAVRRRTSPTQWYYIPTLGRRPSTHPGGASRSRIEPLGPRASARRLAQPSRRKTTVGRLNGRPFYGQAKGQLRPTCTSYAGCAHQPTGILVSTVPITTLPVFLPGFSAPGYGTYPVWTGGLC